MNATSEYSTPILALVFNSPDYGFILILEYSCLFVCVCDQKTLANTQSFGKGLNSCRDGLWHLFREELSMTTLQNGRIGPENKCHRMTVWVRGVQLLFGRCPNELRFFQWGFPNLLSSSIWNCLKSLSVKFSETTVVPWVCCMRWLNVWVGWIIDVYNCVENMNKFEVSLEWATLQQGSSIGSEFPQLPTNCPQVGKHTLPWPFYISYVTFSIPE